MRRKFKNFKFSLPRLFGAHASELVIYRHSIPGKREARLGYISDGVWRVEMPFRKRLIEFGFFARAAFRSVDVFRELGGVDDLFTFFNPEFRSFVVKFFDLPLLQEVTVKINCHRWQAFASLID